MAIHCCPTYPCPVCQPWWNQPLYNWPQTYHCWCGSLHYVGAVHHRPPVVVIPPVWNPPPAKKYIALKQPGQLNKEDINKAKDILKGK